MTRTSPYAEATLEDAYAAWCNLVLPLQRGRGRNIRKPSFKSWLKNHEAKFNAFHENAARVADAKGDSPLDIAQIVATVIATMNGGEAAAEPQATSSFRARRTERRENGARNAVLWALNEEGLLGEALSRSGEFITQEIGTALLTETFGPLSK